MEFVKETNQAKLSEILASALSSALREYGQVVWLVSGGSNIPLSVAAMQKISLQASDRLVVMQADERYGHFEHPDSNWLQLLQAGFDGKRAKLIPILRKENLSIEETARRYEQKISDEFRQAGFILGQFGIGPDGHIAGILPGSSATKETGLVAFYREPKFERITLSFAALRCVSAAFVFVFGKKKEAALKDLKEKELSLKEEPAQILKKISHATVYNDLIGF
ncbi:MAG TPA: 6-phosphogluconolactonase [Candidatus Paceibacterota bacterium]|nr:6-phosphogluconolactonase [Candidatus Paceibacterota bacterium]